MITVHIWWRTTVVLRVAIYQCGFQGAPKDCLPLSLTCCRMMCSTSGKAESLMVAKSRHSHIIDSDGKSGKTLEYCVLATIYYFCWLWILYRRCLRRPKIVRRQCWKYALKCWKENCLFVAQSIHNLQYNCTLLTVPKIWCKQQLALSQKQSVDVAIHSYKHHASWQLASACAKIFQNYDFDRPRSMMVMILYYKLSLWWQPLSTRWSGHIYLRDTAGQLNH